MALPCDPAKIENEAIREWATGIKNASAILFVNGYLFVCPYGYSYPIPSGEWGGKARQELMFHPNCCLVGCDSD